MLLELEAYDKILELGSLLDAEIGLLPLINSCGPMPWRIPENSRKPKRSC